MQVCINQSLTKTDIIDSHKLFIQYLNKDRINTLVHLFNHKTKMNGNDTFVDYIQQERNNQGLDNTNVKIQSYVYGYGSPDNDSSLLLDIIKNNLNYLHLSIHLVPKNFSPKLTGLIHLVKDIYRKKPGVTKK
jgi:hypothetical protein